MAVTISHPLSTPFVQCVWRQSPFWRFHPHLRGIMTTVASAESLPISVLPDLIVNRERVIFGRRTIPLRGDESDTSSYVWSILEQHAPNFDLPGNGGINYRWQIRRGRYCLVPRVSHQASLTVQTIRYGSFAVRGPMLFNTLPSELRNMTNCSSESFKHWTHFSKLYLMSLGHMDTPTWDERILIVSSIWLHLPLPDIRYPYCLIW